jgi:hypothetical protein
MQGSDVTCEGGDGTATVSCLKSGSGKLLNTLWNNGATSNPALANLSEGTYTVTVTDLE